MILLIPCQSTKYIILIFQRSIRTSEKAQVVFKFVKQPENIKVGSRLLFRQGTTKGMGEVIKIYSILDPDSGQCSSNDEAEGGMLVDDQER